MRIIELITDTKLGLGSLGADNLEKARTLVVKALGIRSDILTLHESGYVGWYYQSDRVKIRRADSQSSDERGFRVIVTTNGLEDSQRIIRAYYKILVHGKPDFDLI